MEKIFTSEPETRIQEFRKQFLKGFIGDKLQEPLPKCPIECMFWDWIFSYYPDNNTSAVRFNGFTREFLLFLIDNRRFALEYRNWLQLNSENLVRAVQSQAKERVAAYDVKMYAEMLEKTIDEKLTCVLFYSLIMILRHYQK